MLKNSSSFRDPSGFVFEYQSDLYRSVNKSYAREFQFFLDSGLRDTLFQKGWLVKHEQVSIPEITNEDLLLIIKPERLPVISYPYEWCFSQLKDAALLTLNVMKTALEQGMILKDASPFNIQFKGYKPVFIDTLSFSIYEDGQIWYGYRQFCEHFLAPLCIASYLGVSVQSLLKPGVDGVPLKTTSKLLPWQTWLKSATLMHVHLHAKTIGHYSGKEKSGISIPRKISKRDLSALVDHLYSFINKLQLSNSDKTQWQDYDKETHYSKEGKSEKAVIIKEFLALANPSVIWDMGANDGSFSRSIADKSKQIISLDADPLAIEKNYNYVKSLKIENIYPLLFDLTNPSPGLGWANKERVELSDRSKPDLLMALALIHHIVITYNVPFDHVAKYFAELSEWLIIEFVPEGDEKIKALPETAGKKRYTRENFEKYFFLHFQKVKENKITDSDRTLLLLKRI